MMTNDERDFRHNVISELRGIRKALEKIASNGTQAVPPQKNEKAKTNNHREVSK